MDSHSSRELLVFDSTNCHLSMTKNWHSPLKSMRKKILLKLKSVSYQVFGVYSRDNNRYCISRDFYNVAIPGTQLNDRKSSSLHNAVGRSKLVG